MTKAQPTMFAPVFSSSLTLCFLTSNLYRNFALCFFSSVFFANNF